MCATGVEIHLLLFVMIFSFINTDGKGKFHLLPLYYMYFVRAAYRIEKQQQRKKPHRLQIQREHLRIGIFVYCIPWLDKMCVSISCL